MSGDGTCKSIRIALNICTPVGRKISLLSPVIGEPTLFQQGGALSLLPCPVAESGSSKSRMLPDIRGVLGPAGACELGLPTELLRRG